MSSCEMVQLDGGRWYCPACDPQQQRTTPVQSTRVCGPRESTPIHEQVIRSIVAFMEDCDRSEEVLRAEVACCLACEEYLNGCGRFKCDQRYGKWMELLAKGSCDRW